ncbi:transposase family protein [Pontiella sulfatireligans]|uniref:transposase family protein n=1 Tax=Pontiella sulfatireligans TaxID=2750658 RepID=UPI0038B53984
MAVRRIKWRGCGASSHEPIVFCPDPYVRYTKWAARFVLALCTQMSISAVAKLTGLHGEKKRLRSIFPLRGLSELR